MNPDLAVLVDKAIDEAIRTFDPDEPSSFDRWNDELKHLEALLREEASLPGSHDLLATVQAKRMALAFEIGRLDLVLDQSSQFVLTVSAAHPSFSNVAILRSLSLHAADAHISEIQEVLAIARRPEIKGGEYVSLLAGLGKRHPGSLPADEDLWQKLQRSIDGLRALGYDTLPQAVEGPEQLERIAVRVADELRRVNREREDALLNETS